MAFNLRPVSTGYFDKLSFAHKRSVFKYKGRGLKFNVRGPKVEGKMFSTIFGQRRKFSTLSIPKRSVTITYSLFQ